MSFKAEMAKVQHVGQMWFALRLHFYRVPGSCHRINHIRPPAFSKENNFLFVIGCIVLEAVVNVWLTVLRSPENHTGSHF